MKIIQGAFSGKERMLKCGLHCHTTRSDGRMTPDATIRQFSAQCYDFLALTDHNFYNFKNYFSEMSVGS